MIRILLCEQNGTLRQELQIEDISEVIARTQGVLWVDLESPTDDETRILKDEFGFHELAIEDAVRRSQRPKLDAYPDFYYMAFYAVTFNDTTHAVDEHELDIFMGRNFLVTMHDGPVTEIEEVARRWRENARHLSYSVSVLLYSLLDTVVDDYFPVLDAIGDRIEEMENRLFQSFDPRSQGQIFELRKELLNLRRVLGPERDVLLQLSRQELPMLDSGTSIYYQDVYDHVMRVSDAVDLYRDLLNSALDSYLSLSSNNLNVIMRTLTSVSIIMMTLTVITGVYGMNFENMPELHTRYGYFVVLGFMVVTALSLAAWLRRRHWM